MFPDPPPVSEPVPSRLAQASFAAEAAMAAARGTAVGAPKDDEVVVVVGAVGAAVRCVRVRPRVGGNGDGCRAARRVCVLGCCRRIGATELELVSEIVSARLALFVRGGSGRPLEIEASVLPPWAEDARPAIVVIVVVRACNLCVSARGAVGVRGTPSRTSCSPRSSGSPVRLITSRSPQTQQQQHRRCCDRAGGRPFSRRLE